MKKIFLAICFSLLSLSICHKAEAKATEVSSVAEAQKKSRSLPEQSELPPQENYADMTESELSDFIKERIKKVVVTSLEDDNGVYRINLLFIFN